MKDGSEDIRPAIFLDRDGVLNENRRDSVKSWQEILFLPRVFEALRELARRDWLTLVVTSQSAINRKLVSQSTIDEIHRRMLDIIKHQGGRIEAVLYCPNCDWRKRRPGLLFQAAEQFSIDLSQSTSPVTLYQTLWRGCRLIAAPSWFSLGEGKRNCFAPGRRATTGIGWQETRETLWI